MSLHQMEECPEECPPYGLERPVLEPYTLPMPKTFRTDASSPLAGHRKRSSVWTAIHMWCIPSGKSTPTTSVQRQRLFRLYRFPQAKLSRSIQAVTSGPWTTSSQPMNARRSRYIPNGSTVPGPWNNCFNSRKARWSQQPSTSSAARSPASSTPRSYSTNSRPWPKRLKRTPLTTGPSPPQGPWSVVPLSASSYSYVAGECAAAQDQSRHNIQLPQHLRLNPWFSTWRSIQLEGLEDIEDILFSFCIVSCKISSTLISSVKPPKQRERYTIMNTLQLSIYTSMNTFIDSNLERLRSKTF